MNVHLIHLRTMLIISIVHHGDRPLLPVFDAWSFLCIKKAGLVPIEFANHKQETDLVSDQLAVSKKKKEKKGSSNDEDN